MDVRGPVLFAVMGPTASGKTALAESLADRLDALLLNADAFQVYRGMDIGTAKPARRERYALLDLLDPNETYGVGDFVGRAAEVLRGTWEARRSVVVVGGTGLYVRALMDGYTDLAPPPDPDLRAELNARHRQGGLAPLVEELQQRDPGAHARTDLRNPVRVIRALERAISPGRTLTVDLPPYPKRKVAIDVGAETLNQSITRRVQWMVQNGWASEVQTLLDAGYGPNDPGFRAIGYRAMAAHVRGETELGEALATTIAETRRYAKRQRTWLRSEPELRNLRPEGEWGVEDALELLLRP